MAKQKPFFGRLFQHKERKTANDTQQQTLNCNGTHDQQTDVNSSDGQWFHKRFAKDMKYNGQ